MALPDYLGAWNSGVDRGAQRGLAQLFGQAMQAPREERSGLIAKMAGTDPQSAIAAQQSFGEMDDDKRAQVARHAQLFATLPDEQKVQAYPQLAAEVGSLTGQQLPNAYDAKFLPMIQQVASWSGGSGDGMKSLRVGGNGNYWAIRGGEFVDTGVPADPRMKVMEGAGGIFGVNERTLQATPVQLGGGQPAPQQRAPGEVPFSIDPSLPPEVQAAIRANESQFASAPDGANIPIGAGQMGGGQLQAAPPKVSPAEEQRLGFDAERLRLQQNEEARKAADFQRQQELGGMTPQQAFKLQQSRKKEAGMLSSGEAKLDQTIKLVGDILAKRKDFGGITGMGALGARIPGTDWADLANKLETLKARSAFGSLQEMRANSPTGGALGSVTERELALLQNAETQLGNSQSPESLANALTEYLQVLRDSKRRLRQGFDEFYQDVPQEGQSTQGGGRRLKFNPATGRIE